MEFEHPLDKVIQVCPNGVPGVPYGPTLGTYIPSIIIHCIYNWTSL